MIQVHGVRGGGTSSTIDTFGVETNLNTRQPHLRIHYSTTSCCSWCLNYLRKTKNTLEKRSFVRTLIPSLLIIQ